MVRAFKEFLFLLGTFSSCRHTLQLMVCVLYRIASLLRVRQRQTFIRCNHTLLSLGSNCHLYIFTCLLQSDDVVDVAIEKINTRLESFLGINDNELGKSVAVSSFHCDYFSCGLVICLGCLNHICIKFKCHLFVIIFYEQGHPRLNALLLQLKTIQPTLLSIVTISYSCKMSHLSVIEKSTLLCIS